MKKYLLFYLLLFVFISCSKDDDSTPESGVTTPEPSIITATETCLYSDFTIEANSTVEINCLLDLEGQTIEIPEGVTFEFDGGDILNGTLNFAATGKIDGELLNSKLELEGEVQLTSEVFQFIPSRWEIVEGATTSDIALKNNKTLENSMAFVKDLGGNTFKIDRLDAYFEVTKVTSTTADQNFYSSIEGVNLPSDFNLIMTDNTHLRLYPAGEHEIYDGTILAVREVSNVTITGGNLYGDRDERFYPADDIGDRGSHLLQIHSGKNVTINGLTFEDGSAGSIAIFSIGFSFNDNYDPSETIKIENCIFKNSRRMSIALVDGRDVIIQNNTFIDNGKESTNSVGGTVGYAINIEPDRFRDTETGELKERQRVFDILIKGNTEINSRVGFLTLTIGQDIIVEDNTIDTRIVWSLVSNTKVRNNFFTASTTAAESWAFFATGEGETVFNNEFSGNTISGYSIGMIIGSTDADIYDNTITDVTGGIQISDAIDATIYDNTVESSGDGLRFANTTAENVKVTGNTFTTPGFMARVTNSNNTEDEENFSILIDNNDFFGYGAVSLFLANGVTFSNNTVQGGLQISDTSNSLIDKNTITPNEANGISLSNENKSITVSNNTISKPTGADRFECLNNESTTPDEVDLINNTCN